MTQKQIIAEIKAKNLPLNTQVYKLKIIDGNDGTADIEYYIDRSERDSECEGVEHPYYFERSNVTFKESAFS